MFVTEVILASLFFREGMLLTEIKFLEFYENTLTFKGYVCY